MDQLKTILAKYWVGILCAIIALAAIITSFIPLGGYHEELHNKLKASAANYSSAQSLMTKTRYQPIIPGQASALPLTTFPSQSIINSGKALRDTLNTESVAAFDAIVQKNRHDQLKAGVLPSASGVEPLNYRIAYVARTGPTGTIYTEILRAGAPPTAADIKAEADHILETKYKPQIIPDVNGGKAYNEEPVMAQFHAEEAALPLKMRQDRARGCKVYCLPDALPVDQAVAKAGFGPPDPRKIWWSQMALWVQEDVAKAIAEANAKAADVTTAPIKRIVRLDIFGQDQGMLFTGGKVAVAPAPPAPDATGAILTADSKTPVPIDPKVSPSGRTTCNMYDVIQFHLELVVTSKDIPFVIDTIARNRLISVLTIESITTEDTNAADAAGYFYGAEPVVHITLRCEALFLREWTLPLMPDTVKRILAGGAVPAGS